MAIALGCHKWSFGAAGCLEAARLIRALGLELMDLGNAPDLDPAYVAEHPREEAERFNQIKAETGIRFIDCFPQWGEISFSNNSPDLTVRQAFRRIWSGFFPFAAAIGLTGVTLSPGRYWPGESMMTSFERGAEELRWAVAEAARHGLKLRIEPHIDSVTWTPALAVDMCHQVPGLSLTVDYSHFVFHGIPIDEIATLHPYATHWHARQARLGQAQSRFHDGTIPFDRIVADLRREGYDGVICLEYVHGRWMGQDNVDCVTETILLRDQLRTLLAGQNASETATR